MSTSPNFSAIVKGSVLAVLSFTQIFIFCDTSEQVTSRFIEIDVYVICDWYKYDRDTCRLFPIIIANSQQPVILKGYGNILCTRETFKKVGIWKYFILYLGRKKDQVNSNDSYVIQKGCKRRIFLLHTSSPFCGQLLSKIL